MPKYKFDSTVTPTDDGKWIVKGSLEQREVPKDFLGMVPLYANFDSAIVRLGTVRVLGNSTASNFQVKLPKKPRTVAINLFHDMLEH